MLPARQTLPDAANAVRASAARNAPAALLLLPEKVGSPRTGDSLAWALAANGVRQMHHGPRFHIRQGP